MSVKETEFKDMIIRATNMWINYYLIFKNSITKYFILIIFILRFKMKKLLKDELKVLLIYFI